MNPSDDPPNDEEVDACVTLLERTTALPLDDASRTRIVRAATHLARDEKRRRKRQRRELAATAGTASATVIVPPGPQPGSPYRSAPSRRAQAAPVAPEETPPERPAARRTLPRGVLTIAYVVVVVALAKMRS